MAKSQIRYQKPRIKTKHKGGPVYRLLHRLRGLFKRAPHPRGTH